MEGGVPGEITASVHGPVVEEFLSWRGTVIIHGTQAFENSYEVVGSICIFWLQTKRNEYYYTIFPTFDLDPVFLHNPKLAYSPIQQALVQVIGASQPRMLRKTRASFVRLYGVQAAHNLFLID